MKRGQSVVIALLLGLAVGIQAPVARSAAPGGPGLLAPSVPAELRELEAKTEALRITSLELKLTTSIKTATRLPKGLAALLNFGIEGYETLEPPAAALKVTLFGHSLRVRIVGRQTYLFSWALGRLDGGRPWIAVGKNAIGRLLGNIGASSSSGARSGLVEFSGILVELNNGEGLRALGPATIDGQAVEGFESAIQQGEASGESGVLGAFAAATGGRARVRSKPMLRVYFAPDGLPVRTVIELKNQAASFADRVDIPAIDFPDTISAPPPSHVISEAALKRHPTARPATDRVEATATAPVQKSKQ